MSRTYSCVVPVTIILCADFPGRHLPLTRGACRALAHAMVYDAMRFTEDERGFFAEGIEDAAGDISVSWLLPRGFDDLDELTRRIAKGRRPCTTTKRVYTFTAAG